MKRRLLEEEFSLELNDATWEGGIEPPEPSRVIQIIIRHGVYGRVEQVVEIKPELELDLLCYTRVFDDRHIRANDVRPIERVATERAEPYRSASGIRHRHICRDESGKIDIAPARAVRVGKRVAHL